MKELFGNIQFKNLCFVVAFMLAAPASYATTVFSPVDSGVFKVTRMGVDGETVQMLTHNASLPADQLGVLGNGSELGYFVFDLTNVSGPATAASLSLDVSNFSGRDDNNYFFNFSFNVFDSDPELLNSDYRESNNPAVAGAGFAPFGTGKDLADDLIAPLYTPTFTSTEGTVSMVFDPDAQRFQGGLINLNDELGGLFVVGLTLGGLPPATFDISNVMLSLEDVTVSDPDVPDNPDETPPAIPLPIPALLLLSGLGTLGMMRRKPEGSKNE